MLCRKALVFTDNGCQSPARADPGLHHGFGFKAFDIDIVPEEEGKKRKRRRR